MRNPRKQWETLCFGALKSEIKRCLLLGRKAMINLDSILKSRDIALPTKVHLVKAMVFPVVTYACESWAIKKAEHRRIDAFELWCWKRLLRVPWTAWRSNQSKVKEIKKENKNKNNKSWDRKDACWWCCLEQKSKHSCGEGGNLAWNSLPSGAKTLRARASKNCQPEDNCEESLWLRQGHRFKNLCLWKRQMTTQDLDCLGGAGSLRKFRSQGQGTERLSKTVNEEEERIALHLFHNRLWRVGEQGLLSRVTFYWSRWI